MATLSDFNSYGEELVERVRLRSFPVAVKLLKKEEDIPQGAIRPKKDLGYHLALCQAFAMSRREGTMVAMLKEDHWCYGPVLTFGLAEAPKYYLEGHTSFPWSARTLEMAKNLVNATPCLKYGEYVGIVSAPPKKANFEPDVVMIYCDSVQLANLLSGIRYQEGCEVTSTLVPAGVCHRAIVPVMQKGECQVAIPCGGDRMFAMAQDDEMVFSVPKAKLGSLMLGLRHLDEPHPRWPIKYLMRFEYGLPETYRKMGKMLGMEVPE